MRVDSPMGFPWYRREDYERVRKIMADGAEFSATYDQWVLAATAGFQHQVERGRMTYWIAVCPDEFLAWCGAKAVDTNAASRMKFIAEAVARKIAQKDS